MEKNKDGGNEITFFPTKSQHLFYIHMSRGFLPLTSVRIGLQPPKLCIPASLEVSSKPLTTFMKDNSWNPDSLEISYINYFRLPTVSTSRTTQLVSSIWGKMIGLQILEYFLNVIYIVKSSKYHFILVKKRLNYGL